MEILFFISILVILGVSLQVITNFWKTFKPFKWDYKHNTPDLSFLDETHLLCMDILDHELYHVLLIIKNRKLPVFATIQKRKYHDIITNRKANQLIFVLSDGTVLDYEDIVKWRPQKETWRDLYYHSTRWR
ncbi:MAG: hypothetical protein MJ221_04330 [Bacilli bacterium]|nr:hypothetical protein [Bacilli bacterium]